MVVGVVSRRFLNIVRDGQTALLSDQRLLRSEVAKELSAAHRETCDEKLSCKDTQSPLY